MSKALLDAFRPGRRIYLPGATGESLALAELLAAQPERMRGVEIVSCLLPGMNAFDYAALDPQARLECFLPSPALRASFAAGRARALPLAYSAIARYLRESARLDVAIAHVAEPDADGRASLGIAADFSPIAWAAAARRIALVNPLMPHTRGPAVRLADADIVVELESPLVTVAATRASAAGERIAEQAAALVPAGASIQIGIGGAPAAVWSKLGQHRDLRIASGLVAADALALADAGALCEVDVHRAGIACGNASFYAMLAERDLIGFATVAETHDVTRLAALDRFTAINSAIEVDLFGQANLEWLDGQMVSGVGGAPDFVRAARLSRQGRAMTLLPATGRGGASRIVARLPGPSVSLARSDADMVITEHGGAELRDRDPDSRAEALIAIAAPEAREGLALGWAALRRTL